MCHVDYSASLACKITFIFACKKKNTSSGIGLINWGRVVSMCMQQCRPHWGAPLLTVCLQCCKQVLGWKQNASRLAAGVHVCGRIRCMYILSKLTHVHRYVAPHRCAYFHTLQTGWIKYYRMTHCQAKYRVKEEVSHKCMKETDG